MTATEIPGQNLHRPQQLLRNLQERFFSTPESKEQKIMQELPPVIIRLFGDIDYEEQLRNIPEKFREKVIILTTCDTPLEKINELTSNHWHVVQSITVTEEQAKINSAMLLNEAVEYGKTHEVPYLFFLSSGYLGDIGMFYSMYYEMTKLHPKQDAYYFILPETHKELSIHMDQYNNRDNIEEFLLRGFPFETALVLKTDFLQFETALSKKGELGTTEEKIPLGGMEFFLTLLDAYKTAYDNKKNFSPHMVGVVLPVILQQNGRLPFEIADPLLKQEVQSLKKVLAPQVTSPTDKLTRRVPTWKAAMQRLHLTDDDMRQLVTHTIFENGLLYLSHFRDTINVTF